MWKLLAGLVVVAAGLTAAAQDKDAGKEAKPAPKLSGTWAREADGIDLRFQFLPKDVSKITVVAGENSVVVTGKCAQDKDGTVRFEITDTEEKGSFPVKLAKGSKFSFKFKADGKTAKVTDFEGEHAEAKPVVEGEYKQVEDEKKGK